MTQTSPEIAPTSPRVLLLDDNLMSAMRIQSQLSRLNYHVETRRDVPDESQSTAGFSWVLINLGSRSLNGVALIEICRARFPDAKIIGFCGHLETEIRRAAKAAGIDRILTNDQAFSDLQKLFGEDEKSRAR